MKDPVSGVFRVADWYDAHPHSSPPGTRLTGVVVADGVPPTTAEVPVDHKGKWVGHNELPVTVDRADPSNFRVEWDQVLTNDWRETARQRATEAAARLAGGGQPAAPGEPIVIQGPNSTVRIQTSFGSGGSIDVNGMLSEFFGGQHGESFGGGQQPGMFGGQQAAAFFTGQAAPGAEAFGVLTAVHDVTPAMPLPAGMSQADLTLNVERPDGSTYPVTTRLGFRSPQRRAAIATIGNRLPVLVDPNDPGRVTIDVARLNLP
jgi:hypothetical protein